MDVVNATNFKYLMETASNRVRDMVAQAEYAITKIKWKTVSFTIPIKPEPSHRPRLCGYRVYVPGAAKNQSFFDKNVRPKLGGLFITTPCKVTAMVYCETPKSFTHTQKILAEMGLLRPWVNTGDVDNFLKSILDQMQPNEKRGHVGIMANDCLVIDNVTKLYYSMTPRYEVTISYMSNVPDQLKKLMRLENS